MAKRPAFTLLEVLIAMSLSGFIMLGVMQLYQGLMRYIENAQSMMSIDRQTCLFFNQLERDLATAYIPTPVVDVKTEKDGAQKTDPADPNKSDTLSPEDQKKKEQKEKEIRKTFFVASIEENTPDVIRIGHQKVELLKYISFVCSNPLHIFGEKKQQMVRVVYELVVDKKRGTRDEPMYQLVRRETSEIKNVLAKVDEYAAADKKKPVRSFVLLDNVKGLYLQYFGEWEEKKEKQQAGQPEDSDKQEKSEKKEIRSFKWGHIQQTQGLVPQKVLVWLDVMNEAKTKKYRFHALFPILSFPTVDEEKRKKEEKDAQQQAQGAQGQPGQPGQQPPAVSGQQPVAQGTGD